MLRLGDDYLVNAVQRPLRRAARAARRRLHRLSAARSPARSEPRRVTSSRRCVSEFSGATGPAGRGLAARLASVGHECGGSRDRARRRDVGRGAAWEWGDRVADSSRPTTPRRANAAQVIVSGASWTRPSPPSRSTPSLAGQGRRRDGQRSGEAAASSTSSSRRARSSRRDPGAAPTPAWWRVPPRAGGRVRRARRLRYERRHRGRRRRRRPRARHGPRGGIPGLRAFDGGSLPTRRGSRRSPRCSSRSTCAKGRRRLQLKGVDATARTRLSP